MRLDTAGRSSQLEVVQLDDAFELGKRWISCRECGQTWPTYDQEPIRRRTMFDLVHHARLHQLKGVRWVRGLLERHVATLSSQDRAELKRLILENGQRPIVLNSWPRPVERFVRGADGELTDHT